MDRHHDAARLLLSARRDPTQKLRSLPEAMRPPTEPQAYLIQRGVIAELGEIGGWKVGSPRPDGPINCSPLPASGIQPSPGQASDEPIRAVEAEIGVRLAHDLPARDAPYTEADMRAAIQSAHPIIEVLTGRFVDPDAVDPLSGLADSGAHGGLIVGPAIPDWHEIDLAKETVRLVVNGTEIKSSTGNPGGAMMRLLLWLANTGARWDGGLRAGPGRDDGVLDREGCGAAWERGAGHICTVWAGEPAVRGGRQLGPSFMHEPAPVLHMLCGKVASGKSTLCPRLTNPRAIVIAQDHWMSKLYKEELQSIADYIQLIPRLRLAMAPHIVDILRAGLSVVLDWPANTVSTRLWMRNLFEQAGAQHQLHFLDVPDEICLARLQIRNAEGRHEYTVSPAEFEELSRYFEPPTPAECFDVVLYREG